MIRDPLMGKVGHLPIMLIIDAPAANARALAEAVRFKKNTDWLNANAAGVYNHRGKIACVAGQELYVGDDVEEVVARARAAHPEDDGWFTCIIPKEKAIRIYAHQRRMAEM